MDAANAALHDRMYKEWPSVADLLKSAIKEGEEVLTHWEAPDTMIEERARELRLLVERRRAMEEALEIYRKLAQDYKRVEETILGHYPRAARPGPFFYDGMIIKVHDVDSDHEWRFEFEAVVIVPPATSSG